MARKKKSNTSATDIDGNIVSKSKGLFDHINQIREGRDPKYFDTLTEDDVKSWSNYMVCRFLSMQPDIIDRVNEIQIYASVLAPREFYQLCLAIVPRGRSYFPYIKGKKNGKWETELIDLLREHFQESEQNVQEYLEILPDDVLKAIVSKYGYTEKEVKRLTKFTVKK